MGKLVPATALFTMFLMFIGASPGGTGGGIKTTTFSLILLTIRATLRGFKNTIIFNRRIPAETIRRAFTIVSLSLFVLALSIFMLYNVEHYSLMELSFETFSAFGTVGLSMGITPGLSSLGKIIIIIVMFIGRVGPLTLLLALSMEQKEPKIEPPKEGISIG
jgi:trk system potassium uptake protein TrkH